MQPITPNIRLFTYQESQEAGLHIRCLILNHNGNNYHLNGSTRDTVYVFTESICLYVLTINTSYGYISLNAYMSPEPDPINTIYLHSLHEIKETLGHKWESLLPITIVRKLRELLF
jgi:hypothetical protein